MERREALQLTTSLLGAALVGSPVFLGSCTGPVKSKTLLTDADIPMLNAMAEVILPETSASPGAAEAGVGQFIKDIVTACYSQEEEIRFETGLRAFEAEVQKEFKGTFIALEPEAQKAALTALDERARLTEMAGEPGDTVPPEPPHFFIMLMQLTIWGYFTSEPGATQALRYNPTPGRFQGCVPYGVGERAWA